MTRANRMMVALAGALFAAASAWPQELPVPAPGHEDLPVVFWAHYMAVVYTGALGGGNDSYPFVTAQGTKVDQFEQHIREALKSGINGFQMLAWPDPAAYEAARRIHESTGQMFYMNPQWADLGGDLKLPVERIASFAREHENDPHVFRIRGKQVHFLYNHGRWSGGKYWTDSVGVPALREKLAALGVDVLLMPSSGHTPIENVVLDREDLGHGSWPRFEKPAPGELTWLKQTAWDGLDGFNHSPVNEDIARLVTERLKPFADRFVFMPGVSMGYDSSNRPHQAIHCPQNGIRTLREGLRAWVGLGYRQLVAITWNDLNEAMLLPSSRSPYGYADVMSYYHGLAENGQSPFAEPHTVVSYDSEVLYGDELAFQFLLLPAHESVDSEYLAQVRFENADGEIVSFQTLRVRSRGEGEDAFGEMRIDTLPLAGQDEILSPIVSVVQVDPISAERKEIVSQRRLAPVRLRYNLIHFSTSYAISLNHVAADTTLDLRVTPPEAASDERGQLAATCTTGDFMTMRCRVSGKTPLRKLHLAESRISCGSFRADDTAEGIGAGMTRQYVRLRTTHNGKVTIELPEGVIEERYARAYRSEAEIAPVGEKTYATKFLPYAPNPGTPGLANNWTSPVIRLRAPMDAPLILRVTEPVQAEFTTTLAAFSSGPVVFTAPLPQPDATVVSKQLFALRVEIAVGAQEPNFDFAVPAIGTFLRTIPFDRYSEPVQYFHAWSLDENDQVAYSRPVRVVRTPAVGQTAVVTDPAAPVVAPLIHTLGTLDDFVDTHSSVSRNPFTKEDLVQTALAARSIPYYLYDMDEGVGDSLGSGGQATQLGYAWISGAYRWIDDGWRGKALALEGGKIQIRSKSFPHGAYTFSIRLRAGAPAMHAAQTVISDGDYWMGLQTQALWLQILPDGKLKTRRSVRDVTGEIVSRRALDDGWNHVVTVCDLQTLRLYLNGELQGEVDLATPAYQRTHLAPVLGFDKSSQRGEPATVFTGAIDQMEIIGAPLGEEDVAQLYRLGQWRTR